jgi:MiaB-like tRNA modifying enzyme
MKSYVYIETFGCSANQNNSEILAGLLKQSGYEITSNEKISDILIINTCIVKGKTESKIKRRIQDLSKLYPNKLMIISGCMPETDSNQLKKLNPKAILLGIHHVKDIVKLIKNFVDINPHSKIQNEFLSFQNEEKILLPKIPNNKLISIIQISEGCFGECSYCKVRLAKGKLFSYIEEKIINSIQSDLQSGAKEIWLTSQDCASYNLDKGTQQLPELLKKILSLNRRFKLRLGMMNPNHLYPILNEMIEIYKNPKIYKFLHIPIQSASNKILKDMKRPYTIEQIESIINKFKSEIPDISISTDIIVGYPTETEEDHKKNIEFIQKFKPSVFNLSKFSSHINTEAGKFPTLSTEIINKRASELMELHRKTALENKKKFLGKTKKVFVNVKVPVVSGGTLSMLQNSNNNFGHQKTKIPGIFESRDENYNIILINSKDKSILGKNIKVKINQIGVHHMIGEMIIKNL